MPGNWADYPDYPFCSHRCKTIDLGRWLGEDYKVSSKDDRDRSTPGDPGSGDNTVR
jgi:endogenous inhibitor of DNA gyrase (YacG/DUF329 family)